MRWIVVLMAFLLMSDRASAQVDTDASGTNDAAPQTSGPKDPPRGDAAAVQESFVDVMTVTGSRRAPSDLEFDRSVSITSQEDRRAAHASSVPDWISELPGVFLQETNRSAGAPIIRGFMGPQNLLLIDGVRLNTSIYRTGPLQYLSVTDPFAFTRVEVLRGPGSALYGSDAFGGVIHMRTPQIEIGSPLATNVSIDHGTADNSLTTNVDALASAGPMGVLLGVDYRQFGVLRSGDGVDVPLSDNRHLSARGKLRIVLTESLDVQTAIFATNVENATRIDRLSLGDYRITDNQDYLTYARVTYRTHGFVKTTTLNLSYQRLGEQVDRYRCATDASGIVVDMEGCLEASSVVLRRAPSALTRKMEYRDMVDAFGGFVSSDLSFLNDDLTFSVGAEAYSEKIGSEMLQVSVGDGWAPAERSGNFPDNAAHLSAGVFAHGNYVPLRFADTWQVGINAGCRYTYANTQATNETLGDVDSGFSSMVGTAGIVLSNPQLMGIYFNWSQGFRAPGVQESVLVGNTGSTFEIASPDLGPEQISALEGGLKVNHELGFLRGAYFFNRVSDLIIRESALYEGVSEYEGVPVTKRVNGGTGKYDGVEVSAGLRYQALSLHGQGTWTRGRIRAEGGERDYGQRVPPLFFLAGLRYDATDEMSYAQVFAQGAVEQSNLSAADKADLRICEDRYAPGILRASCERFPGWVTLNVRVGRKVIDPWWLDLAVLNLTDERYRVFGSGFDAPGIGAKLSLTASY